MEHLNLNAEEWEKSKASIFWGEIAPCDHVVQIYEHNECFFATLEEFVASGLAANEGVILVATDDHIREMDRRLFSRNIDIETYRRSDQYMTFSATAALTKFMINGWPDELLFNAWIDEIVGSVKRKYKKVRVFGELVALLWADGKCGATVHLELLWSKLHDKEQFSLYCAYPKTGFTQNPSYSAETICRVHHRLVDGELNDCSMIYHRESK